jgi:hypothetical protein
MKTLACFLLVVTAAISSHSQAHADGFKYAGSPKLGESYVRTDARISWADARAELPRSGPTVQVRGGIARRMP